MLLVKYTSANIFSIQYYIIHCLYNTSALIYKDLQYLQELAFEMKTPMLTGSVVKDIFARTYSAGIEQEDFSAVYKLLKKRS
ncbi:MAG: hypothetical protein ACM3SM_13790 [Bacteroidota bacterium]